MHPSYCIKWGKFAAQEDLLESSLTATTDSLVNQIQSKDFSDLVLIAVGLLFLF